MDPGWLSAGVGCARAGRLRRKRRRRRRLRRDRPGHRRRRHAEPVRRQHAHVDPNLVNAWGIAFNPQGFVWVANAGTSTSTLYDGNGVPQSLVVAIPPGAAGEAEPTGIVFNASPSFPVTQNGRDRRERVHLRRRGRHDLRLVADRQPQQRGPGGRPLGRRRDLQGPGARHPGRRRLPLRDRLPQRRRRRLRRALSRRCDAPGRVHRSEPAGRLRAVRHPGDRQPDLRQLRDAGRRRPRTTSPAPASARSTCSTPRARWSGG